ncbi:MAG: Nif3-like dinuclear metal center hexameric protein [Candidatus Dojkabacteria bacterium]|nr:Nif3-like dinuclear metal center hexameric protein [Candidatus Dojkabacteria bacterium]
MIEQKDMKEYTIETLAEKLDTEFRVKETVDPAMSRFVPMVYDPIDYDWKSEFEPEFTQYFNGLMITAEEDLPVGKIWLLSFLNDYMLEDVLEKSSKGDMIFAHHPVQMECGDPREGKEWGKGFIPINPEIIKRIKEKGLSIYTCHAPLDAGSISGLGTNESLIKMIGAKQIDQYMEYAHGYAARICEVPKQTVQELIERLEIPNLDYIDIKGNKDLDREITKVAIIPGGGGNVRDIQPAEGFGTEVVITGQATCRIAGERGERENKALQEFYPQTKMTLIGLSHAGSEYPVMEDIAKWFKEKFQIEAEAIPENSWWR